MRFSDTVLTSLVEAHMPCFLSGPGKQTGLFTLLMLSRSTSALPLVIDLHIWEMVYLFSGQELDDKRHLPLIFVNLT